MSTKLKALLSFQGLVLGVPVVVPHGLNWSGTPEQPDVAEVLEGDGPYTITATATTLSITRLAGAQADVDVLVESWHTLERAFDGVQVTRLSNQTLVIQGASPGGGGTPAVDVEDEGVAIPGNPHSTLNFVGPGVTAADAGAGVATITIPGDLGPQVDVEDEGAPIAGNPHSTLNFIGAGVVATDAGGGVADITIPA